MSKALRTAGTIVAGVALVATGIGAAGLLATGAFSAGTAWAAAGASLSLMGVSASTFATIGAGMAFLGDATAKPLKVGGMAGSQVDFAADPNAPIPYPVGRTGTGGRIVYATTGEAKNRNILYCTVLGAGGPIDGFESFKAAGEAVTISPLTEAAIGGTYNLRMWQRRQLGGTPAASFLPPNTFDAAVLGEWTATHKMSGYAAAWYVLGYDQKTYASGVPEAVWTIRGALVYDPREDGTYPGGAGLQRIDDPASWTYSENPYLHALAWCLGRYANGVRVLGIGAPAAALDIGAFVEAANVADANDWKVGGVVYSNDSKWDVLKAMCQAGGGRPVRLGASITVLVNAPRVSVATLTADDLVGGYSVQAAQSVRGRPNQIIPKYRSEVHGWEMVAAGPVKVPAYVTADKRLRSREVSYPLVQDARQVAQLAAYDLVNGREFGPVTVACKPQWMGYRGGDCITVDVADLGMNGQKALILTRTVDPMTGEVSLTLQSETDAKHDYALGRTANAPPIPGLTGVDLLPSAPTVGSWSAVGGVLLGSDGAKIPAIIVTGEVDDPNATHLIVEYRQVSVGPSYGPWVSNEYPASSTRIEIAGVKSAATYQVRVRYRTIRGLENTEVFLDLGLVIVGSLSTAEVDGIPAAQVVQGLRDLAARGSEAYQALIKLSLDQAAANGALEAKTFTTDGLPVGPLAYEQKIITAGLVQFSTLLGIISEDESAIILNQLTVEVSPGQSLASFLTYVESVLGDGEVSITFLLEALNGVAGRVAIAVENGDQVVGLDLGVDGVTSHFDMISNKFRFIDPDGVGAPTTVLSYSGGKWKFNADLYAQKLVAAIIEAEHLTVGSVTLEAILQGAASDKVPAYTTTRLNSVADGTAVLDGYFEPATNNGVEVRYNATWHYPSTRTTLRLGLYRDGSYVVGSGRQCSFDGQDEDIMSISFLDPYAVAGANHLYEVRKLAGTSCDQIEASMIMEELRR